MTPQAMVPEVRMTALHQAPEESGPEWQRAKGPRRELLRKTELMEIKMHLNLFRHLPLGMVQRLDQW